VTSEEVNPDTQDDPRNAPLSRTQWLLLACLGAISGFLVGQSIDNAYPLNNALHYHNAWIVPIFGSNWEFVWFIPILYATAGALIVVLITFFSRKFSGETGSSLRRWLGRKPRGGSNPSWGFTILSIIAFVVQWWLGCYLSTLIPNAWLFAILIPWGLFYWWIFDGTGAGLLVCLMVACLGPLIEITLINGFGLYHYTNPDIFGVPLWFIGHYIGGTPANMNLGRKYLAFLTRRGK
jgi:hypothetical protein